MLKQADLEKMSLDQAAERLADAYLAAREVGLQKQAAGEWGNAGQNALIGAGLGAAAGAVPSLFTKKKRNTLGNAAIGAGLGALTGGVGTMAANSMMTPARPFVPEKNPTREAQNEWITNPGQSLAAVVQDPDPQSLGAAMRSVKETTWDAPYRAITNLPGNISNILRAANTEPEDGYSLGEAISDTASQQWGNFRNGLGILGDAAGTGLRNIHGFFNRQ